MSFSDDYTPGLVIDDVNIVAGKDTALQTIYDAMAFAKSMNLIPRVDRNNVEGYDLTKRAIEFINMGISQLDNMLEIPGKIQQHMDKLDRKDIEKLKNMMKKKNISEDHLKQQAEPLDVCIKKIDEEFRSYDFDEVEYRTYVGPLQLADIIGLDTVLETNRILRRDTNDKEKFFIHPRLRQMVEAGHLGKKSGRGFYEYN